MAKKRVRVVTAQDQSTAVAVKPQRKVIGTEVNPKVPHLTDNEKRARRYATTTSMGGFSFRQADTLDSGTSQFYSPQLSTDFLEKPQNLRERRAFYRFFYNTNEIIGQAIDIHSTLPLSKLRLVPPKGKNKHQNEYVYKFFTKMCEDMKLFKTLIEITHEYYLFGNCHLSSTDIRTFEEVKAIKDIKPGDLVLTDKKRWREVEAVSCRKADEILKIKTLRSYKGLNVTEEHPIEVYREKKFVFVKAKDIKIGDYIRITWPEETIDVERKDLTEAVIADVDIKYMSEGYTLSHSFSRMKSMEREETCKTLLDWLSSLEKPVIISCNDLAKLLNVRRKTLDNAVIKLHERIGTSFHKRKGAKGRQKGSQVIWYPIDSSLIGNDIETEYEMTRRFSFRAPTEITIDEDFAYLVGYWLGDGTIGRDKSRKEWGRGLWQICFGESSQKQFQRILQIVTQKFGAENVKVWKDSNDMLTIKIKGNPLFLEWWANNFGETSRKRNKKRVPLWFTQLPVNKLKSFLAGVFDSDGCLGVSGYASVGLISKQLIDSIEEIGLKCGIIFSKSRQKSLPRLKNRGSEYTYNLQTSDKYSCDFISSKTCKKFINDIKSSKRKVGYLRVGDEIAFKVKSITRESGDFEVYNLQVEEDNTYQANGFSTHNCFIFAEEDDWKERTETDQIATKKEEAKQRSELLKERYEINDKNPLFKGWKKLLILPPDQVRVRKLPLTDDVAIEYMPDPETRKFLTSDVPLDPTDPTRKLDYSISRELREKVRQSGVIPSDTDPNTGSHVYHLARKKSQYEPLGVSIVERCINTLILMDKLRQAQTSIASRHMTPMRIVWADELNQDDVDNLREQVDLALVDPDFSIVANYEIHWEEMGSSGRLLDVEAEMESSLNRLLAGLGVTREVLTGEGTYTGSKISLEIMNTMYLLFREVIQDYIENYLFKPIARKKGFMEYDEYGNEVLLYPRISFTRLAIRDNEQFFDAAFQLYQKGSISIDLILDILNIDPDSTKDKIERDLFTVNDSLFNEMMRNLYTNVAAPLVEETDVAQKLAEYLKLKMKPKEEAAEGESRFSSAKSPEHRQKLAKIIKFLAEHPEKIDNIFTKAA